MTRVIKDRYEKDFTIVKNVPLQDTKLSLKGKGAFMLLWSLPDDWDFKEKDLVNRSKDGSRAFNTAIQELRVRGYVEIRREHSGRTNWFLHEVPSSSDKATKKPRKPKVSPHMQNAHVRTANVYKGLTRQSKIDDARKPKVNPNKPKIMNLITTYFHVSNIFLGECSKVVDDWLKIYTPQTIIAAIDTTNKQQLMKGSKIYRPCNYVNAVLTSKNNTEHESTKKPKHDDNFVNADDIAKKERENQAQAVKNLDVSKIRI